MVTYRWKKKKTEEQARVKIPVKSQKKTVDKK